MLSVQADQKRAVVDEVVAARGRVVDVVDVFEGAHPDVLRSVWGAFVGGRVQVSSLQVYVLETAGNTHFYVQPFTAHEALPGEHHVVIAGAVPASARVPSTFGAKWTDAGTGAGAASERLLAPVLRGVEWQWRVPGGVVEYTFHLATRPLAPAHTHVAMSAVGAEPFDDSPYRRAGFAELYKICGALTAAAARAPTTTGPFVAPVRFASIFEALMTGQLRSGVEPPRGEARDFGAWIQAGLAPAANKDLLVAPGIPPRKEANARKDVLPAAAAHLPIVAVIDRTVFGSCSEAVVLTPTHCFWGEAGTLLSFPWSDLRVIATSPMAPDCVVVTVAGLGVLALPAAGRVDALGSLLHAIASAARAPG